jgi:hypothetical protein
MPPASQNVFFIYYKVPVARRQEAAEAVEALQAGLRSNWPGVTTRLMRRSDEPPGAQGEARQETWMEVYEHADGLGEHFVRDLQARIAKVPAGLMGVRHTETFSAIAPTTGSPA